MGIISLNSEGQASSLELVAIKVAANLSVYIYIVYTYHVCVLGRLCINFHVRQRRPAWLGEEELVQTLPYPEVDHRRRLDT